MAELSDDEYERVRALSHLKRMRYLMRTIAERREVVTLTKDGQPLVLGEPGAPDGVGVWPDVRFARAFADAEGATDAEPTVVPVETWLDEWIPRLRERRQVIALFPFDGGGGQLDTWEFEDDLRDELEPKPKLP